MIPHLSPEVARHLYVTWVRPSTEYACPVWHASITSENSLALERLQASVARRLLRANWTTPKSELLKSLNWPALWWRRSILTICLLYDLYKTATPPLSDCLYPFTSNKSDYKFRKPKQLLLPITKTTRQQQSFFYHASLLWNSLPNRIQELPTKSLFKKGVEEHWEAQKFQPTGQIKV